MRCVGLWRRACRKELSASTCTGITGYTVTVVAFSFILAVSTEPMGNNPVSLPRATILWIAWRN